VVFYIGDVITQHHYYPRITNEVLVDSTSSLSWSLAPEGRYASPSEALRQFNRIDLVL
jgi:hypothetical protein